MTLRIGMLVMVVRTGTALDGATGTIVDTERWQIGWNPFAGRLGVGRCWTVRLARAVAGAQGWCIQRAYLLPLQPPNDLPATHTDTPVDSTEPVTA